MLLRLLYLTLTNVFTLIRLLPRNEHDKDAEILALRHQLTVLPATDRQTEAHLKCPALPGGACGDAQDMDAPGGNLHDEEDVETLEEDGLHVHEVAGEQRVGL
ncbi:hypothetical protein [Streptomyces asiaticus]|uniref:hypothetical protein n=1 Tax=Streptomyces asiaticus TaxID=114695 RepID=UPI003D7420AE